MSIFYFGNIREDNTGQNKCKSQLWMTMENDERALGNWRFAN